jgi:hypothetical protein
MPSKAKSMRKAVNNIIFVDNQGIPQKETCKIDIDLSIDIHHQEDLGMKTR